MALTRVSPALFQVSNNITSVTVGGSANTVSLTFDSNGVITGASNNALSVANTQITGLIQAAQIGSANATLATSGTLPAARLPAGSVLQVVNATYATGVSSSTNVFADTGLTASITPSSVSSKILVLVSINDIEKTNNSYASFALIRNASNIVTFSGEASYTASASTNATGVSCNYLDSPASTSATTYKVQFKSVSNNAVIWVQTSAFPSSQITLMEIAG